MNRSMRCPIQTKLNNLIGFSLFLAFSTSSSLTSLICASPNGPVSQPLIRNEIKWNDVRTHIRCDRIKLIVRVVDPEWRQDSISKWNELETWAERFISFTVDVRLNRRRPHSQNASRIHRSFCGSKVKQCDDIGRFYGDGMTCMTAHRTWWCRERAQGSAPEAVDIAKWVRMHLSKRNQLLIPLEAHWRLKNQLNLETIGFDTDSIIIISIRYSVFIYSRFRFFSSGTNENK